MKVPVRWLAAITAGAGTVVGVLMILLGMEPRLVLVGCVVVLVAATAWLVIEMASTVTPLAWYAYGTEADTSARPDRRVQVLRSRLRQPAARRGQATSTGDVGVEPSDEIIDSLLGIIDEHLVAEHGVDRSIDPDRAAELLGPELTRFISDPVARRAMTQRRTLANTVSLIEDL